MFANTVNKDLSKVSLQLQWLHQFQFAGYYIAKEKGFYKDVGLDVDIKEYSIGEDVVEEVITDQSQYAIGRTSLIVDRSKGKKLVIMSAILQASPLVLVSKKRLDIKTIKDFKDKKIMLTGTEMSASIFAMLSSYDIDEKNMQIVKSKQKMKSLIDGNVDIISAYTSNQVYKLKQDGIDIKVFNPKDYGFDFYSDILFTSENEYNNYPQRVYNFNSASLKGWEYAFLNIDETIELIMKKYNSQNKSKEDLIYEANELKKLAYYKTNKLGDIDNYKIQRIYDIYNVMGFIKNPIDLDKFVVSDKIYKNLYLLTDEEKKYLKNKKIIKMCVDPDWMPFEKIEKGEHIGLASDYMKLISTKIETPIVLVDTTSWTQSIEKAKNRECDIYSIISITNDRKKYMDFTSPYLDVPIVIATKTKQMFLEGINQVLDEKIGIVKGYSVAVFLKEKYPNINIVDVKSISHGMKLVEKGEIFGYVDNLASINYEIQQNFLRTIKISGRIDMKIPYRVATRNDEPILNSIFEKTILDIDSIQKQKIFEKWVTPTQSIKIDYTLLWQLIVGFIIILLIILYFYNKQKKLKEQVENLNKNLEQKVEEKTKEQNILLSLFDKGDSVLFKWNNDEHKSIVYISLSISKLLGYDKSEFLNHKITFNECIYKEDFKMVVGELSKASQSDKDFFKHKPYRVITKNGNLKWVLNYTVIVKDENNKITHYLEYISDITQEKEQERLFFEQSKMASMGEMIGNISHQWRQPLSVISTGATGLKLQKEFDSLTDEFLVETCDMIDKNAQYLSKTIDDFRDFIKGDRALELFNLEEVVYSFIRLIEGSIKNNDINMIFDLQKDLKLNGFPNELIQCFMNIFNNSKDAFKDQNEKLIFITTYEQKDKVIIVFKDNAGGIADEILNRIFDPYFTTKHKSQGTGLGLNMTYNLIVDGMKGIIKAQNTNYTYEGKNHKGAEFIITLKKG